MSEKTISIGGRQYDLTIAREGNRFRAGERVIEMIEITSREAVLRVDGKTFTVPYFIDGTTVSFSFDGETYIADVAEKGARTRAHHRDHSMSAPMPGLVLKLLVKAGDVVDKGKPLVILEAMKMEHQIVAPFRGRVESVNCREGELVQPGVDLVEMEKTMNDER